MACGPARFCQSCFWSYDLSLPTWSTGLMPAESFYWYFIDTYWPDAAHSVCACFSCLHMHRLSSLAWWAVPLAPAKSIVWISGLANHGPTRQGSWKALHGATFTKKDERIFVQFASPKDDESRHIQDIQDIICLGLWASDELKSICSVCSKCWFTTHVRKMLQFDGVCDGITPDLFFRRSPKTTRLFVGLSFALLKRSQQCLARTKDESFSGLKRTGRQ